jgi:hypothetical protein
MSVILEQFKALKKKFVKVQKENRKLKKEKDRLIRYIEAGREAQ